MLPPAESFDDLARAFRWEIPALYNIGVDICDKWADRDPARIAIVQVERSGDATEVDFATLRARSNRLANALAARGVAPRPDGVGDRVGVLLPQSVETALAHIAVTKMGCVSIPLFTPFGEEALLHRLRDSGARAVVTDGEGAAKLATLRDRLPELRAVLSVDGAAHGAEDFNAACAACSELFEPVPTRADDPAILIYTSGTTGNPKGALHAHRVLPGHLPGVELSHDFLPQPGDRIWSPADWAWIGGLLDVMMPALHHGISVVAHRFDKFDARAAFALMADHGVRNAFLPPTALKMMRGLDVRDRPKVTLRTAASGGETLDPALVAWGREALGTTINEFYGQTECNMIVSSCAALSPPRAGSMGRAVPGHAVEVIDAETGAPMPPDTEGEIAVRTPDPVMFLRYWNAPDATAAKFVEPGGEKWLLTGDRGRRDAEGWLYFIGRDDDVIGSAGYRIGPAEIEDCLSAHPAVQLAGVVGYPDDLRGSVVAAYVVLGAGHAPSDDLARDIAAHVRTRLAAHEYPRVVRFIDEMPMTTTGKIIRARLRAMAQDEAARS